jgi:DNA-nicking Smr family endonuclease
VKKKYLVSNKDKKDWDEFTNQLKNTSPKLSKEPQKNIKRKVNKLDLHGYTLVEANKLVKNFIIKSFDVGLKKLTIVTGKGLRSESYSNPYVSEDLSILKNSIPTFIKDDEELKKKVNKISKADQKDGGDGAIYIFLKTNKNIKV